MRNDVSSSQADTAPARQRPQRTGELATLPVFFDLKGKRAAMAGGSDGAAWKAELLATAGAHVDLYCEAGDLGDEMRTVLQLGFADGAIRHHDRPWGTDLFEGAPLAVAEHATFYGHQLLRRSVFCRHSVSHH